MLKKLKGMEMRISARNVWLGNIKTIDSGIVNSVVTVRLKGRDTIVAVITNSSVERLELAQGKEILAIVKAPDVLLSHEIDPDSISASNILSGPISRIVPGKVNDEVTVELDGGNTVTSILTSNSVKRLGLEAGVEVHAIVKASNVLLAIP
jgi:molybdate transport system regulatory protein